MQNKQTSSNIEQQFTWYTYLQVTIKISKIVSLTINYLNKKVGIKCEYSSVNGLGVQEYFHSVSVTWVEPRNYY